MQRMLLFGLACFLFTGCKKKTGSNVEIYVLKSFNRTLDQSMVPAVTVISNAVLEDTPLVTDENIAYYTQSTSTFTLKQEVQSRIKNFGPDKAFAVTVNKQPVYYGSFHPLYLSSITFGVPTIAPSLFAIKDLRIDFFTISGNAELQKLDKRNDPLLLTLFRGTGRLR